MRLRAIARMSAMSWQRASRRRAGFSSGRWRPISARSSAGFIVRPSARGSYAEQREHVARKLAVDLTVVEAGRAHSRCDNPRQVVVAGSTEAAELGLRTDVLRVHEAVAVATIDQLECRAQPLPVARHLDRSVVELV